MGHDGHPQPDGDPIGITRTFMRAAAARARQEGCIGVVTDQVGSPTFTDDLAGVVRQVLEGGIPGLFHAAGEGSGR